MRLRGRTYFLLLFHLSSFSSNQNTKERVSDYYSSSCWHKLSITMRIIDKTLTKISDYNHRNNHGTLAWSVYPAHLQGGNTQKYKTTYLTFRFLLLEKPGKERIKVEVYFKNAQYRRVPLYKDKLNIHLHWKILKKFEDFFSTQVPPGL